MASPRILLVEGQDDREFFQHFICELEYEIKIEPETPKDFCQSDSDGVDVLRTRALPLALRRLKEGKVSHLGIIIDADFSDNGYGFSIRRQQITKLLNDAGYDIPETPPDELTGEIFHHPDEETPPDELTGEIFHHPDEYPSIGLWIMPKHQDDGMLEDLLLTNLGSEQQTQLLAKADQAIANLDELQLFKDIHLSKARLATLLAWQRKPGTSTGKSYKGGTYKTEAAAFIALADWLNRVFLDNDNN